MAGLGAGEGEILLGQPALAERAMRALEMKGDLPRMMGVEFQPTIATEDLTTDEFWWLRRGRRFALTQSLSAGAGLFSVFELVLNTSIPIGSMLAVTDGIVLINNDAAATQSFVVGLHPLPNVSTLSATKFGPMDDRQGPNTNVPAFGVGASSLAVQPLVTGEGLAFRLLPGVAIYLPLRYVLTGRQVLSIVGLNNNLGNAGGFVWRERDALTTET